MIIQIRGTSGSGKTTVMRAVMKNYVWTPIYEDGAKKPTYYLSSDRSLVITGHYETVSGGCDRVGGASAVYALTQKLRTELGDSPIILQEGLLLSEDTKWSMLLPDLRIVYLTTTPNDCLERVKGRRVSLGITKPLSENNTLGRVKTIERSRIKLSAAGVMCRRASSEQAPRIILGWISEWL